MCLRDSRFPGLGKRASFCLWACELAETITVGSYFEFLMRRVAAVSYTHLDVYKRQVCEQGIDLVLPICRKPMGLEQALDPQEATTNLICAGEAAARSYDLGRI